VAGPRTQEALLEQGALLFARHGVAGVTTRQLHEAVGARNESAVHYHFGGREGLVTAILRAHVEAVEARRAVLVAAIEADDRSNDLRTLVHALVAPMAESLDTELGRAHLRLAARFSHPALAYEQPFQLAEAPAGRAVVRWLRAEMAGLPGPVCRERLAVLRVLLVSLLGQRAELLDDHPSERDPAVTDLFVQNLIDMAVAGLRAEPSADTLRPTQNRNLSQ
jgi:AcrR family transcriptional regulator